IPVEPYENEIALTDIPFPQVLGTLEFRPGADVVRKYAWASEDESGYWVGSDPWGGKSGFMYLTDPAIAFATVAPVFLCNYVWYPEGFYVKEPYALGHYTMLYQKYPNYTVPGKRVLHARTDGVYYKPFRLNEPIYADVKLTDIYEKRGKYYMVIEAFFMDKNGYPIASFKNTNLQGNVVPLRLGKSETVIEEGQDGKKEL
ncbi:hypothetical protein ACFLW3_01690, partial [Chloroflexota bacterium]